MRLRFFRECLSRVCTTDPHQPLVYSCSGRSSAARLAHHVALRLARLGVAQMACIAGVGKHVPHLLNVARSGRPIIALDGCSLACTGSCLDQNQVPVSRYYQLQLHGVKKRLDADFDPVQADEVVKMVAENLGQPLVADGDATFEPREAVPRIR